MPRQTQSEPARIVGYFRKSPIEVAEMVLGLCKDAVGERKALSTAAKKRAKKAQKPAAAPVTASSASTPAPARKVKAAKPRKARKSKGQAPVQSADEVDQVLGEPETFDSELAGAYEQIDAE